MFSFNSPFGMCPTCNGLGFHKEIDEDLVIPNKNLSISQGAIAPYSNTDEDNYYYQIFKTLAKDNGFSVDEPIKKCS
jgi:Excinuclease ATPase subunit